jgi:hypothetical protein
VPEDETVLLGHPVQHTWIPQVRLGVCVRERSARPTGLVEPEVRLLVREQAEHPLVTWLEEPQLQIPGESSK